ncbi:hypothetical protein [Flavivirga algicola]|uniref:PNPLA domain-containing protein n=1 Tax=Flavivirga algicola TaxID=2729136 RepID=A0ABX1RXZ0_9FLAO|nr:hypothetical protein [Flavivirga algicola]NMH87996.1 hypothetical protein [Flavivirga algicola]
MSKSKYTIKDYLSDLFEVVKVHSLSLTFVIIIYILFWFVPQINDLILVIIQVPNDFLVITLFFASIIVFALIVSNIQSYFKDINKKRQIKPFHNIDTAAKSSRFKTVVQKVVPQDEKEIAVQEESRPKTLVKASFWESKKGYIHRMFPKLLSTYLIMIIAFSVNNTYEQIYSKPIFFLGNWWLLIILGVFLLILHPDIMRWLRANTKLNISYTFLPPVIAILCLLLIMALGFMNKGGTYRDTRRFFISISLLGILFYQLSVSYNIHIIKIKKILSVVVVLIIIPTIFIMYIILYIDPTVLKKVTPLVVTMICLIGIFSIFNVLRLLGHISKLPVLTSCIIVGIVLTIINANRNNFQHYEVSEVPTAISPNSRLDIDSYVKLWVEDRKEDILKCHTEAKFPIILVSAEGGGSRAGLWSLLVHSYLYEKSEDYFNKYLFSITGASGGNVGNNIFYAHAFDKRDQYDKTNFLLNTYKAKTLGFKYKASEFYNEDYLSVSVASLLGRDLLQSIVGFLDFKDRGKLLEIEWEKSFNKAFGKDLLSEPYLTIMPKKENGFMIPILVTNTTDAQFGNLNIMSSVKTEKDIGNMAIFKDIITNYPKKDTMVKRSTAMLLNARFPYISPTARITGLGQYGDAGYYDNIGGVVTKRLETALLKELANHEDLKGKYRIKHLFITNNPYEGDDDHKKVNYSSQLITPAKMILNATFAHPNEIINAYGDDFKIESKRTYIPVKKVSLNFDEEKKFRPILPLGRYLSWSAIKSLEERLKHKEVTGKLDSLLLKTK